MPAAFGILRLRSILSTKQLLHPLLPTPSLGLDEATQTTVGSGTPILPVLSRVVLRPVYNNCVTCLTSQGQPSLVIGPIAGHLLFFRRNE